MCSRKGRIGRKDLRFARGSSGYRGIGLSRRDFGASLRPGYPELRRSRRITRRDIPIKVARPPPDIPITRQLLGLALRASGEGDSPCHSNPFDDIDDADGLSPKSASVFKRGSAFANSALRSLALPWRENNAAFQATLFLKPR